MWQYWMLFILPAWGAVSRLRPVIPYNQRTLWPSSWCAIFVLLVLMIGMRHEVGGDWFNYLRGLDEAAYANSLTETFTKGDPAYGLLIWMAAKMELGPYFVNSVCGFIFTMGLLIFCRAQPRPWLALVVAVPYLITVVAMGYTRQSVAIGLAMLGLVALDRGLVFRFLLWLALAAAFHKSAIILLPIAVLAGSRNRLYTALWVGAATLLLYKLLLQESVEILTVNYLEAEVESSGAMIRIAMNVFPAFLFLLFRRHFQLRPSQRIFWTWIALGAVGFMVLIKVSPSSTAVDRVALYWIPLQLFVLSHLPSALGRLYGAASVWVFVIIGYSAAVLFVWLFFAAHAHAWLPYQFYPWVRLWQ